MEIERSGLSLMGDVGNKIAKGLQAEVLVRLIGIPFQKLIDKAGSTHRWLTERAVAVLEADGFRDASTFFRDRLDRVIKGNYWADSLWMNSTHHYNPKTKRGLWIWPGATDQIGNWFDLAVSFWTKGLEEKSVFVLGACLHIVQDCCQPYHSNCCVFNGHQKYEKWADQHKSQFRVEDEGCYNLSSSPEGWAIANAEYSAGYLGAVSGSSEGDRLDATNLLIPRAARTTAGFLLYFLEHVRAATEAKTEPVIEVVS